MTFGQSLSTVILPQALRTMVQPLVNIFIGVALGSSMAAAVAVPELTYTAQQIGNQTAESMLLFVISAAVYIVIALLGGRHRFGAGASAGGAAMSRPIATRVLFDEPGPRGRARIRVLTVVICLVVAAGLVWSYLSLSASGELAWPKWKPFVQQWAVWFMLGRSAGDAAGDRDRGGGRPSRWGPCWPSAEPVRRRWSAGCARSTSRCSAPSRPCCWSTCSCSRCPESASTSRSRAS